MVRETGRPSASGRVEKVAPDVTTPTLRRAWAPAYGTIVRTQGGPKVCRIYGLSPTTIG